MALLMFLLALPIFLLFVFQRRKSNKKLRLPPGPPGLPLIGNLHQFDSSNPQRYLWQLSTKYGPLMSLRFGFVPAVVVSSAKIAKEVLKTHDLEFCSRPALRGQHALSYNGLDLAFAPYNEYYKEMRKLCAVHLFNPTRSQSFHPIRKDEVSLMIDNISKSADDSKVVNLSDVMLFLTINIICRIGFGKSPNEEEGSGSTRFHMLLNETQAMFGSFFVSDYFPFMGWVDYLSGLLPRLQKNFNEFDAFYQELIDEHLDPNRPKNKEDIIDVLLQISKQRDFKIDLTYDHIKAVLMNVFVAGTDTSAATVVWAMSFMMKNPTTMKKAQEEVRNIIGERGFVDEADIPRLTYMKAVIKETYRMQPAVPLLIPRETLQKCKIEGYDIPAKTMVYVNAWAIGRDPEIWKNPEEFCPERFIGSSVDLKGQDFELIPFGAGRRICPGLHLGLAVVDLALANLLYKFDWEMPPGMKREDIDFDVLPGIVVLKKNALCLVAKKHA